MHVWRLGWMEACMDGQTEEGIAGGIDVGWMEAWMDVIDGRRHGWRHGWMEA